MTHCKCEILIPLLYGRRRTPVEPQVLLKYQQIFNRQFGGFTPLGTTAAPPGVSQGGLWADGEEVVEDICWLVRIYVPPNRTEEFKTIARLIGRELEQKEMLIDIGEPTGMFLKIAGADEHDEPTDNSVLPPNSDESGFAVG